LTTIKKGVIIVFGDGNRITQQGSSFTVAFITSMIVPELKDIRLTHGEVSVTSVLAKLSAKAKSVQDSPLWRSDTKHKEILSGVKKAVVFPFAI
jgi:hypothetical protein